MSRRDCCLCKNHHLYFLSYNPENPDLLFLGTEYGLFVSIDKGKSWVPFTGNLPEVSIRDMVIQERESALVLATHGRGIVIIDDLTPLRQINAELIEKDRKSVV